MRVFGFKGAVLALSLLVASGFAAISMAPAAYGQSNISGDIAGTVTDPSGAAVSNAQVTVTSDARGDSKVVTSDSNGSFRVPLLSTGKYKVSVTAAGFQTATADTTNGRAQ